MSEQAAASNTPPTSGPTPCKMGCGFFGSSATGDCCSKCWATVNKKSSATATPSCLPVSSTTSAAQPAPVAKQQPPPTDEEKPQPMEIEETKPAEATVTAAPAQNTPKKKKKKKTSYKNMMAGMMKESSPTRDTKDKLKHVTGGGAFSKIDKI